MKAKTQSKHAEIGITWKTCLARLALFGANLVHRLNTVRYLSAPNNELIPQTGGHYTMTRKDIKKAK